MIGLHETTHLISKHLANPSYNNPYIRNAFNNYSQPMLEVVSKSLTYIFRFAAIFIQQSLLQCFHCSIKLNLNLI